MKLKEYNCGNTKKLRSGLPAIGINPKTGIFNINKIGIEKLGLKSEDQIVFHQDETDLECWYVEKVKENGFIVRFKNRPVRYAVFNCAALSRTIAESFEIDKSFKAIIAGEPTKLEKRVLYGLLISNPA